MDFWYYFLHIAINVSNRKASIGYITPRYWINSAGATKLIFRIKECLSFLTFVDIGNIKTFDNVEGYHMIAMYDKARKDDEFLYKKLNSLTGLWAMRSNKDAEIKLLSNQKIITAKGQIVLDDKSYTSDFILGDIYAVSQGVVEASDRISKNSYSRMPKEGFFIGQGVFVLNNEEIDQLGFSEYEKSFLKKYLDGKDVGRYSISFDEKYLIYSDKDLREAIESDARLINIKKHLDNMSDYITSSNAPYGIHRPRKIEAFLGKKIIGPSMFKNNQYTLDSDGYFVGMSFNVINQLDEQYSLEFLLALLNSKFAQYWFYSNGKHRGAGVDIGVDKLREFPLPKIDRSEREAIAKIALLIIDEKNKGGDTKELEFAIDKKVYEFYALSPEEIALVEEAVK